jgi:opacity protein-like surface antigen
MKPIKRVKEYTAMKRRIGSVAAVFLFIALAGTGFSQVGIYLGAFGGTSAQSPSAENTQFDTDTTFVYGLRAGVRVLMLGLELSYFQAAHNIQVGSGPLINWDGQVNDYSFIGVNAKIFFPLLILYPYLTAGYGYYTADIHAIDKDNEGGFNFGAGLEIKLGRRFGLAAEGRYQKVNIDIQSVHLGLGGFTLSGGFNFYF